MNEYRLLQQSLARGWNTWNTRSVLSHVLLPEGFALNLGLREYVSRHNLSEAQIGRSNQREEQVYPGAHAYDGSYTELILKWQGMELMVQSAHEADDLVLLVTPLVFNPKARKPPLLVVEGCLLWNKPGYVQMEGDALVAHCGRQVISVWGTLPVEFDPHANARSPYLCLSLAGVVGLTTGARRTLESIQEIIYQQKAKHAKSFEKYGQQAEIYKAIQVAIGWDTIYEPEHQRVVSPVSRIWNVVWGGYVLFEWDNYFAAYMAMLESRGLAYVNAVEMTREITEDGLVPNFATVNGCSSRDRSEPPVGALVCREIYRKFGEKWFLEEVYPGLLRWNRWWHAKRRLGNLLCWGSHPYEPVLGSNLEWQSINDRQGGAYESGLDNLPVYDDVEFDTNLHLLLSFDVGLNGLYVADCAALAEIAIALGKEDDARELRNRAETYRRALAYLWDSKDGIYKNRHVHNRQFSTHLAPTSFYPLLAQAATQEQAERMVKEHFYNPSEFWGEYLIPSIARNDPAYREQHYWRGRIWGPMNLLTYLSLRKYGLRQACKDLAEKSKNLLLKEWLSKGHVHENYNAETGEGCDSEHSDAFYHWGGLLGLIALIEEGLVEERDINH